MPLSLFGYNPKSRVEGSIGTESKSTHTFGGQTSDFDIVLADAPLPLHLIYRIDVRDPLVPFWLPGVRYLPLLYCFNYGTECCYQVLSDTNIKLLHPCKKAKYFPPWEAPNSFPRLALSFSQQPYDPTNADDVLNWKGIFGWDELTENERERALDLVRERTSLTADDGPEADWTYADAIRSMYHPPFAQSKPYNSCGHPDCEDSQLRVIALQDNVEESEMIWPDPGVQTIWEMCSSCRCITVSNQCT